MRQKIIHTGYRFFSSIKNTEKTDLQSQTQFLIEKIKLMRSVEKYDEALTTLSKLEEINPEITFKSGRIIRGEILSEKLKATGNLDKIFTSKFLKL